MHRDITALKVIKRLKIHCLVKECDIPVFICPLKCINVSVHNEEQIISGCPIDGAISVRVDGGF